MSKFSQHKEKAIKAFNYVDLFRTPISLNIQGKRMATSTIGGIISVGIVIFLITQSCIQLNGMANRAGSKVLQMDEYQNDPQNVGLNQTNNFIFAVGFTKNNAPMNLSDSSLFSFTSTYSQYVRNPDGSQAKYKPLINWAPCERSQFHSQVFEEGTFQTFSLQYAYCPTYINYTDAVTGTCPHFIQREYPACITPLEFNIRGTFLSINFNFISFRLTTCNQADQVAIRGLKCQSGDLNSQFAGNELQMNLYFANSMIDPANHLYPNKTFFDTIYWNVNPTVSRVADIFVDSETVQDFDSYLSKDKSHNISSYSIQSSDMRELQQFSTSYMLQWNFRRSNINHVTTRTYVRLLDVISAIGGLGSLFMATGYLVMIWYNIFKYHTVLSNKLYDYQVLKKETKKNKGNNSKRNNKVYMEPPSPLKIEKGVSTQPSEQPSPLQFEVSSPSALLKKKGTTLFNKKTVKSYLENLTKVKQILPYNEWAYIKSLYKRIFKKNDKEEKLARKAREQVRYDLDLIRIIEKLHEIDKLKLLLLNRHQREAFDFVEKPIITLTTRKPIHRLDSSIQQDMQGELDSIKEDSIRYLFKPKEEGCYAKLSRLYNAYKHLEGDLDTPNMRYNKKLLGMLGDDLVRVFKQVDEMIGLNPDPRLFEETIDKLLDDIPEVETPSPNLPQRSPFNIIKVDA